MFHRERAVTGRIFQALPNFCPHKQIDRHVQEGTLNPKTTPYSHRFKIYRPGHTDRLTELIYKIVPKVCYMPWTFGHHVKIVQIDYFKIPIRTYYLVNNLGWKWNNKWKCFIHIWMKTHLCSEKCNKKIKPNKLEGFFLKNLGKFGLVINVPFP